MDFEVGRLMGALDALGSRVRDRTAIVSAGLSYDGVPGRTLSLPSSTLAFELQTLFFELASFAAEFEVGRSYL